MKLPHAEHARVDREKVTEYLLCASHPDGKSKAEFFTRFGFRLERWAILSEALLLHGTTHDVVSDLTSEYGTRYVVDGPLETPDGRNPRVRTVWIIEKDTTVPRLVTAYPA